MKLKSKTIIYELEDGSKAVSLGTRKRVLSKKVLERSIEVVTIYSTPKFLYELNKINDGFLWGTDYYLSKQEAIQAAKDYLEGEK